MNAPRSRWPTRIGVPLALADDPRPAGCKKLKGYKDLWRVRAGDWRVVYIIDDVATLVTITQVAHRREVYE